MSSNWCHNHPQTCCFQSSHTHWRHSTTTITTASNVARESRKKMFKSTSMQTMCGPLQCERNSLNISMRNIHIVLFLFCLTRFEQFFTGIMPPLVHIFIHMSTGQRLGGKISFAFSCFVSLGWGEKKRTDYEHQHWPSASSRPEYDVDYPNAMPFSVL